MGSVMEILDLLCGILPVFVSRDSSSIANDLLNAVFNAGSSKYAYSLQETNSFFAYPNHLVGM